MGGYSEEGSRYDVVHHHQFLNPVFHHHHPFNNHPSNSKQFHDDDDDDVHDHDHDHHDDHVNNNNENRINYKRSGESCSLRRRPRGRPPGSKNKPKPPIIITRDSPNVLGSHVLEFSASADILDSLSNYARRRGRGLTILSGTGTVSNVTLRQPSSSPITLRGSFHILSLTGTVLPPPAPPHAGGLSIFLAASQAQVVGGMVLGPLLASGPVVLMAASFSNAVFERLPLEEAEAEAEEDEDQEGRVLQAVLQPTASQSSEVTGGGGGPIGDGIGGGGGVPVLGMGLGYPFAGDLFGWGNGNAPKTTTPQF